MWPKWDKGSLFLSLHSQLFRISNHLRMSEAGNWCLIESDPGVFTELVQKFGVSGVQVMYAKNREYGTNMRTWYWKSESGESELLGGRAVEFGQRAVYRSQTCVRVCHVLSTFANCTPTVMFYPQCNSIDLMQALRFSFGTFRSSRPHSISKFRYYSFLQLLRGLRPVHQWFFSDPCLYLATYCEEIDSSEKFRLIFLFKWTAEEEPSGTIVQDSRLDNIFFAKQVWDCLESPADSVRGKY